MFFYILLGFLFQYLHKKIPASKTVPQVLSDAVSRLESEIDLRRELEVSIVEARKKAEELSTEWSVNCKPTAENFMNLLCSVDIQQKCCSGRKNLHSEEQQLAEQHRMVCAPDFKPLVS